MEYPPDPPLPQPSGVTCPNCGAAQSAGTARCFHCGAPIAPRQGSGFSALGAFLLSLVLALVALGLGGIGSCMVILAASDASGDRASSLVFAGLGLLVLVPALACLWAIGRLNRKL